MSDDQPGQVTNYIAIKEDISERKLAEQALRESEEKHRLLLENLQEGVWAIDSESRTTFVNRRMAEMLGYPEEEMLGKHLFDFMDERGIEVAQRNLERRRRGIKDRHDFEFLRRDGTRIYTTMETSPITDDEGNYLGALAGVMDISERRWMEEALRKSEGMFRTLAEQSPNMIFINQGGRIVYANARFEAVMGYTTAEFYAPDFDFLALIAPEDRELVEGAFRRHLRGEHVEPYAYSLVTKASKKIAAIVSTTLIDYAGAQAILGTVTDISQLKQAEERRATLYLATQEISASINEDEICAILHKAAAQVMPVDAAVISLRVDGENEIDDVCVYGAGRTRRGEQYPIGPGLTDYVMTTGRSLRIDDLEKVSTRLGFNPVAFSDGRELGVAVLAVPLQIRGRVIGMMAIESCAPQGYTAEDQELLEILAAYGAAAFENAQLYGQAQELAVAEERSRLARDLHDSVTQTLYSVALMSEALPRVWEQHPGEARKALGNMHRLARGALGEMRTLLLELQPAILLEKDLGEVLCQLADATMGRTQTIVETKVRGEHPLPDKVRVAVYRIVQEALNNVVKHAAAGRAMVELDLEPERAVLCIHDDGCGFDPQGLPGRGSGVRNMADRAQAIGAEFRLESQPGQGTRIEFVWQERAAG
jgi:PAS domain S-box-containing protein